MSDRRCLASMLLRSLVEPATGLGLSLVPVIAVELCQDDFDVKKDARRVGAFCLPPGRSPQHPESERKCRRKRGSLAIDLESRGLAKLSPLTSQRGCVYLTRHEGSEGSF